jgi:hypothetical protein
LIGHAFLSTHRQFLAFSVEFIANIGAIPAIDASKFFTHQPIRQYPANTPSENDISSVASRFDYFARIPFTQRPEV